MDLHFTADEPTAEEPEAIDGCLPAQPPAPPAGGAGAPHATGGAGNGSAAPAGSSGSAAATPGVTWHRSPCLGLCELAPAVLVLAAGNPPREQAVAPATSAAALAVAAGLPTTGETELPAAAGQPERSETAPAAARGRNEPQPGLAPPGPQR